LADGVRTGPLKTGRLLSGEERHARLPGSQPRCHVYVQVNREFLSTESHGFLSTRLYITVIGEIPTADGAKLLAAWLSKRVTAPMATLTVATQAIAQVYAARLPLSSTDELGRMSASLNQMP